MFRGRHTKVVATLGPASSSPEQIRALFDAGADVFRLNMSHGGSDDHRLRYEAIRRIEKRAQRPIGILADLQGPKLRIGRFATERVALRAGQRFRLDSDPTIGSEDRVHLPHPEILAALRDGTEVLLDDGKIRLRVERRTDQLAETIVQTGGTLSNNKGVNVPGVVLPMRAMTEKDRRDLDFVLNLGVDWVGLSFVQRAEDVAEARKLIAGRAGLLAKIEKPSALAALDDIVEIVDGIMVARGDLGVELPLETVPGLQKRIVSAARQAGKPVVVATQMLESMIGAPSPTRAEVSDVATAVYDGADAVMLSAESAAGQYPTEAVAMMDRIIRQTERETVYHQLRAAWHPGTEATSADAISTAARQVAETLGATAIVTFTTTGSTALRTARQRPAVPVMVMTPRRGTARRLAVLWGAHCVREKNIDDFAEMVERASRAAAREGLAKPGERIVITAGVPFGTPGATNILRIALVEDASAPPTGD
ncbi:MAG: pyruvate kinase [Alphaproteobacteria bacterium]|nr:pyruvate kinase [Alphaproteobacteria bacterium]